jgi:hypothetical protein
MRGKNICFKCFNYRLGNFGQHIGVRLLDLLFLREKKDKREIKFIDQLNFIKKIVWKVKIDWLFVWGLLDEYKD